MIDMKKMTRRTKRLIAVLIVEVIIAINVFATFAAEYTVDESVVTTETGETSDVQKLVNQEGTDLEAAIEEFEYYNDVTDDFVIYADDATVNDHVEGNIAVNELDGNDSMLTIKDDTNGGWSGYERTVGADDYSIVIDSDTVIKADGQTDVYTPYFKVTDENGDPVYEEVDAKDDNGRTIYKKDSEGNMIAKKDDDGNVVYKTSGIDWNLPVETIPGYNAQIFKDENGNDIEIKSDDPRFDWNKEHYWVNEVKRQVVYETEKNQVEKIVTADETLDPNGVKGQAANNNNNPVETVQNTTQENYVEKIAEKIVGVKADDPDITEEKKVELEWVTQQVNINDTLSNLVESGKKIEEAITKTNTTKAIKFLYETKDDKPSVISTLKADDTVVLKFAPSQAGTLDFQQELEKLRKANVNGAKIIIAVDTKNCTNGITVVNNISSEDAHAESHNSIIFSFGDYKGTVNIAGANTNTGVFIAGNGTVNNINKLQGRMVGQTVNQGSQEVHMPQASTTPRTVPTPKSTPSATPEETPSATPKETPSATPVETPSATPSETPSATPSETPSETPSATPSETPSATPSETPSATPSETPSATPSETPSATPSETPSATPSETPSATPSETPSATPEETPSATPEETPTATPEETPTPDVTPTPEETPGPGETPTPEVTPSPTPEVYIPPVVENPPIAPQVLGARRTPGNGSVLGARRGVDKAVLGKRRAPSTGDSLAIFAWIAALAASLGGAVACAVALKKTK